MSNNRLQEPVDQLHADCLRAVAEIRRQFKLAAYHASLWRPAPMPKDFR